MQDDNRECTIGGITDITSTISSPIGISVVILSSCSLDSQLQKCPLVKCVNLMDLIIHRHMSGIQQEGLLSAYPVSITWASWIIPLSVIGLKHLTIKDGQNLYSENPSIECIRSYFEWATEIFGAKDKQQMKCNPSLLGSFSRIYMYISMSCWLIILVIPNYIWTLLWHLSMVI